MNIRSLIRVNFIKLFSYLSASNESKVIFYHDIHSSSIYTDMSTSVDVFIKHVKIIRDLGYQIVPRINNPIGQIEISFDDGFKGLHDNLCVIHDLNVPVQVFCISSKISEVNSNYLNHNELIEMNASPNIRIGSHTHAHKDLTLLSEKNINFELSMSKDFFHDLLDIKVDSMCFPYGRFNNKVIEVAMDLGYVDLYSSIPGLYFDKFHSCVIKRSLVQFSSSSEFKSILRGGDHILAKWYENKHYIA